MLVWRPPANETLTARESSAGRLGMAVRCLDIQEPPCKGARWRASVSRTDSRSQSVLWEPGARLSPSGRSSIGVWPLAEKRRHPFGGRLIRLGQQVRIPRKPAEHKPGPVDRAVRAIGAWPLPTVYLLWIFALLLFVVADVVAYCFTP